MFFLAALFGAPMLFVAIATTQSIHSAATEGRKDFVRCVPPQKASGNVIAFLQAEDVFCAATPSAFRDGLAEQKSIRSAKLSPLGERQKLLLAPPSAGCSQLGTSGSSITHDEQIVRNETRAQVLLWLFSPSGGKNLPAPQKKPDKSAI